MVVKALTCKEFRLAPYAHLINDVSLFSYLYSQLSYSHVKRNGNKVVHSLTKLLLTSQTYMV